MKVIIDAEGSGIVDAIDFAKKNVIVARRDLARIGRWAKKHGLYAELKDLDVKCSSIEVVGERPKPERARKAKKAKR